MIWFESWLFLNSDFILLGLFFKLVEVSEAKMSSFVFLLTCTFHTIGLVIKGLIMVSAICSVS